MKFKFRLEVLKRQRKAEQDIAQRDYANAQLAVREQMALIESMYKKIDEARVEADRLQARGGSCAKALQGVDFFISGQKKLIEVARHKARSLMAIEEEKHEILVSKVQDHKILEKLKEKKKIEFKKQKRKLENKEIDDIVTMSFNSKRIV